MDGIEKKGGRKEWMEEKGRNGRKTKESRKEERDGKREVDRKV